MKYLIIFYGIFAHTWSDIYLSMTRLKKDDGELFVPRRSNLTKMRQFLALTSVFCLTILLSSCAWNSNTSFDRTVMAAEKARAEKSVDKKAREEEKELRDKETNEKKEEHKNFALIKNEQKKDNAKAMPYPGRSAHVSKLLFAKEILAVNERLQTISTRVKDLSAWVQTLPGMKMGLKTGNINVQNSECEVLKAKGIDWVTYHVKP